MAPCETRGGSGRRAGSGGAGGGGADGVVGYNRARVCGAGQCKKAGVGELAAVFYERRAWWNERHGEVVASAALGEAAFGRAESIASPRGASERAERAIPVFEIVLVVRAGGRARTSERASGIREGERESRVLRESCATGALRDELKRGFSARV